MSVDDVLMLGLTVFVVLPGAFVIFRFMVRHAGDAVPGPNPHPRSADRPDGPAARAGS